METIANICKGTENLGNNQTDLKLKAFEWEKTSLHSSSPTLLISL